MAYTARRKIIRIVSDILSDTEARELIVEARIHTIGYLDVFEDSPIHQDCIQFLYGLKVDENWDNSDPDKLLEYAKDNMPNEITFGVN